MTLSTAGLTDDGQTGNSPSTIRGNTEEPTRAQPKLGRNMPVCLACSANPSPN